MRFLLLGSKEYPVGSSRGHDSLPSGGYETYVQGLAHALNQHGHAVSVVTRRFDDARFEKKDKIEIHRVGWIPGFFFRNPSFNLNAYFKSRHIPYDVCISNGVMATLCAIALKKTMKKPVISRPGGLAFNHITQNAVAQRLIKHMETYAYSHADAVVFLSEQEKEKFHKNLGFLPRHPVLIPTGIDPAPFVHADARPWKKKYGKRLIVFVGRLKPVKGADRIIQAMEKIDGKLLIVGDGPQKSELEQHVRRLELEKKVVFLGPMLERDVAGVLRAADVFVLPSRSEGLPITLLEAWAAQCPAVVSDIGLPVEDEVDALVVSSEKPNQWAESVTRLLDNPTLAEKLRKAGFGKISRQYTWSRSVRAYEEVAKRLCAAS